MSSFYFALWVVLALAAILHLLVHKREPISTVSWSLFVLLVPVLGPAIYFSFGPERLIRQAFKRKKIISPILSVAEGKSSQQELSSDRVSPISFFNLLQNVSSFPVSYGNRITFLTDPQEALNSMIQEISAAKSYIHLEYYIISSDAITENIFDSLIAARNRGVEVRILYDSLGSLSLKRLHFRKLKRTGIHIAGFLPFSLIPQRINFNFRNHRKILVVDGRTAFTGGTNLGREYLGKPGDHQWRDFSIQLWGPVCHQLEEVFRADWKFTTQEDLSSLKYYPPLQHPGNALIQVIDSGPDTSFQSLHRAIFGGVTTAQKQISLMTPYFIPDSSMLAALEVAALRGVDLKLVFPEKNDQWLVKWASRSYYDELLEAGAKIFEFQPKILHAKLMTIDDELTLIGSGNMDIRSFRLNFEITLLIQDVGINQQAQKLFDDDKKNSVQIQTETFRRRGLCKQLTENSCRLLAPIL